MLGHYCHVHSKPSGYHERAVARVSSSVLVWGGRGVAISQKMFLSPGKLIIITFEADDTTQKLHKLCMLNLIVNLHKRA